MQAPQKREERCRRSGEEIFRSIKGTENSLPSLVYGDSENEKKVFPCEGVQGRGCLYEGQGGRIWDTAGALSSFRQLTRNGKWRDQAGRKGALMDSETAK